MNARAKVRRDRLELDAGFAKERPQVVRVEVLIRSRAFRPAIETMPSHYQCLQSALNSEASSNPRFTAVLPITNHSKCDGAFALYPLQERIDGCGLVFVHAVWFVAQRLPTHQ